MLSNTGKKKINTFLVSNKKYQNDENIKNLKNIINVNLKITMKMPHINPFPIILITIFRDNVSRYTIPEIKI